MKTLKSMNQFVLEINEEFKKNILNYNVIYYYKKIVEHANLLSQQLNIGMFVPAVCEDEVWRVLELPKENIHNRDIYYKDLEQYQQAQSKVLFEGFKWNIAEFCDDNCLIIENDKNVYFIYDCEDFSFQDAEGEIFHTLEDLVKFNLEMR